MWTQRFNFVGDEVSIYMQYICRPRADTNAYRDLNVGQARRLIVNRQGPGYEPYGGGSTSELHQQVWRYICSCDGV